MMALAGSQHWLQALLHASGQYEVQQVLQAGEPAPEVLVVASAERDWSAGAGVYARGYWLRLLDCLSSDFPLLLQLMGQAVFELFGRAYLQSQPPAHYSLYQLSQNFADFLNRTCPPGAAPELQLPAALAKVERARAESWREKGPEAAWSFAQHCIESVFFLDNGLRFVRPETVKVCELELDLLPLMQQLQHKQDWTLPEAKPVVLWLARQHYKLQMGYADDWLFSLLQQAVEPVDLDRLAMLLATQTGQSQAQQKAQLMIRLPLLLSQGLLMPVTD